MTQNEFRKQALQLTISEKQVFIGDIMKKVMENGEQSINADLLNLVVPPLLQHYHELTKAETELRILNSLSE